MLIARRDLSYAEADGTVRNIPVCLFAPETKGRDWWCRCTIGWPDRTYESRGHGVDQVQAIVLTLQMTGARLYGSEYHETGRLYFQTPGSGYGCPVPKLIRDELVGDDKRFDG